MRIYWNGMIVRYQSLGRLPLRAVVIGSHCGKLADRGLCTRDLHAISIKGGFQGVYLFRNSPGMGNLLTSFSLYMLGYRSFRLGDSQQYRQDLYCY